MDLTLKSLQTAVTPRQMMMMSKVNMPPCTFFRFFLTTYALFHFDGLARFHRKDLLKVELVGPFQQAFCKAILEGVMDKRNYRIKLIPLFKRWYQFNNIVFTLIRKIWKISFSFLLRNIKALPTLKIQYLCFCSIIAVAFGVFQISIFRNRSITHNVTVLH